MPVASCSLAEPELVEIGAQSADGHISSSVYFESLQTELNRQFVDAYHARFPEAGPSCADVEASYVAVHLLARAIRRAGTDDMVRVRAAIANLAFEAPQGRVHIDRENRHCYLTPRIGISSKGFAFDIIYQAPRPVKPDPYLVWDDSRREPVAKRRPSLTVVQ
jgi:urea transport system substrate-binding protein